MLFVPIATIALLQFNFLPYANILRGIIICFCYCVRPCGDRCTVYKVHLSYPVMLLFILLGGGLGVGGCGGCWGRGGGRLEQTHATDYSSYHKHG